MSDCLVQSTDFGYSDELSRARPPIPDPLLSSVGQRSTATGGRDRGYLKRSLPPVEFEYSVPTVHGHRRGRRSARAWRTCRSVSTVRRTGGSTCTAKACPGLLTEQAGAWYYKRNLGPLTDRARASSPRWRRVGTRPNTSLAARRAADGSRRRRPARCGRARRPRSRLTRARRPRRAGVHFGRSPGS